MNAPVTAAGVVLGHLSVQAQALRKDAEQFAAGQGTGIHRLRVTTRRLRSVLASFEPVLDAAASETSRTELKWFAGILGAARDVEVIRDRLAAHLDVEGGTRGNGGGMDERLVAETRLARAAVGLAIASPRFGALIAGLDRLVETGGASDNSQSVGFRSVGSRSVGSLARSELVAMIRKDLKRLRRSVRLVRRADNPHERDLRLHEVRKHAKRLRYACECAAPATGKSVRRLGRAAQDLQEVLGEHQDSVALRAWLSTESVSAATMSIVEAEEVLAIRSEDAFREAWRDFPREF